MDWWLMAGCLIVGAGIGASGTSAWARRRLRKTLNATEAQDATAALELVAQRLPIGVLLFAGHGEVLFANPFADHLLFAGQPLRGRNFLHLLGKAPSGVGAALAGAQDTVFSLDEDGQQQTFQMLRREVEFRGSTHILLVLNPLTRQVARREIDVLKKVIRVVSHELNNSLASLSSLINSGRYIADNPEQLPKLTRVLDGMGDRTAHLQRFLGEYTQLSRLPVPRITEVAWTPLVRRLQSLYPTALVDEPPAQPGWFDEVQVEQALINLLKNAEEAGAPEAEVRVVFRSLDDVLEIGVLDRGTGFSQEALQQGLMPFYSTKENGSGVGLALCREVADGHGGALRIKNRAGGGSAVYIQLPLQTGASEPSPPLALSLTST